MCGGEINFRNSVLKLFDFFPTLVITAERYNFKKYILI